MSQRVKMSFAVASCLAFYTAALGAGAVMCLALWIVSANMTYDLVPWILGGRNV